MPAETVGLIMRSGLRSGRADACRAEALAQRPDLREGDAGACSVYCSPDIAVAEAYASPVDVEVQREGQRAVASYRVVFMCRVDPVHLTQHQDGRVWRVHREDAIRPYGILLKRV